MPRIKQLEAQYAEKDFQQAIFTAMVKNGMQCSVKALSDRIGVSNSNLNNHIRREPQKLTVYMLRKIVKEINPDIGAVLSLLGYSGKQIRKFKEESQ